MFYQSTMAIAEAQMVEQWTRNAHDPGFNLEPPGFFFYLIPIKYLLMVATHKFQVQRELRADGSSGI